MANEINVSPALQGNSDNSRLKGIVYFFSEILPIFKKLFSPTRINLIIENNKKAYSNLGKHQFVYREDYSHKEDFMGYASDFPDLKESERISNAQKDISKSDQQKSYMYYRTAFPFEETPAMILHFIVNEDQQVEQVRLDSTQENYEVPLVGDSETDLSRRVFFCEQLNQNNQVCLNNSELTSNFGNCKLLSKDVKNLSKNNVETCQAEQGITNLRTIKYKSLNEVARNGYASRNTRKVNGSRSQPSIFPNLVFWESLENDCSLNGKSMYKEIVLTCNDNSEAEIDERNSSGVLEVFPGMTSHLKEKNTSNNNKNSEEEISIGEIEDIEFNIPISLQTSEASEKGIVTNTIESIEGEVNESENYFNELHDAASLESFTSQNKTTNGDCQVSEGHPKVHQTSEFNSLEHKPSTTDVNISFIKSTESSTVEWLASNEIGNIESNVVDSEKDIPIKTCSNSGQYDSVHEIRIVQIDNEDETCVKQNLTKEPEEEDINTAPAETTERNQVKESTDFSGDMDKDSPSAGESAERQDNRTRQSETRSLLRENEGILHNKKKETTRIPVFHNIPLRSKAINVAIENTHRSIHSGGDTLAETIKIRFTNPLQQDLRDLKINPCENNDICTGVSKQEEASKEKAPYMTNTEQTIVHKYSDMTKGEVKKCKPQSKLPTRIPTNKARAQLPSYEANDKYHKKNGCLNISTSIKQNSL